MLCGGTALAQGSTQWAPAYATVAAANSLALARTGAAPALVGVVPALKLRLRLRVSAEQPTFAQAYRPRSLDGDTARAGQGTRIDVEWRLAKSTLGLEHGALGMQLASGQDLSLKVRHGGPKLYLRSQF